MTRGRALRGLSPGSVEPDLEALGVELDVVGEEVAEVVGREGTAVRTGSAPASRGSARGDRRA
jgi:hypothetical protein